MTPDRRRAPTLALAALAAIAVPTPAPANDPSACPALATLTPALVRAMAPIVSKLDQCVNRLIPGPRLASRRFRLAGIPPSRDRVAWWSDRGHRGPLNGNVRAESSSPAASSCTKSSR